MWPLPDISPFPQIWLGVGQLGQIVIYYGDTLEQKHLIHMGRHSITNMVLASDQVWMESFIEITEIPICSIVKTNFFCTDIHVHWLKIYQKDVYIVLCDISCHHELLYLWMMKSIYKIIV